MVNATTPSWRSKDNMTIEKRYRDEYGNWNSVSEGKEKLKKLSRAFLSVVFTVSLGIFIFLLVVKPPLPKRDEVLDKVIFQEPFQSESNINEQLLVKGDYRYKIYPQYSYELYGLVVSQYDSENILDVMHKKDPAQIKDLCVVWGDNVLSGIYQDLKYKSGEFTCYAKPKSGTNLTAFSMGHLSNNHLIPADADVAEEIRKANIGDQVYIEGYLSRYEIYDESGSLVSSRGTSVSRDDGGNGACETVYVTSFEVLKGYGNFFALARNIAGGVAVLSFIILIATLLFV